MKQIVVLEDCKEVSLLSLEIAILGLHLSKNEKLNVVIKKSFDEVLTLMELLGTVDLIVCEMSYVEDFSAKFPEIECYVVDGKTVIEQNVLNIVEMLGCGDSESLNLSSDKFRHLSISYFTSVKNLIVNSDLYIKIKKGDSVQFVKRLNANEVFTDAEVRKYVSLGLTEFYVQNDRYEMVVNSIINILGSELAKENPNFNAHKKIELTTYHISVERLKNVGIDTHTIQLVDETIHSIQKAVGEKGALGKFLGFITQNKTSYSYASSYMTCLTMSSVLKYFDWDSDVVREQVALACFFHNISLEGDDEQKISSDAQLEMSNFTKEIKDKIKLHALAASGIASAHSKISPFVLTIIKEHHGSPTGVGFPETPSLKLHPMSKCFMVCEYFSDQILALGVNISKEDVLRALADLKNKFSTDTYIQYANAIEKMCTF